MYSEIQRTAAGQSSCRSRSRDLADSRTTNSSKYGTRNIRYQTNTITAPQNESGQLSFATKYKSRMDSGSIHRHTPHIVRVKERSRRALHAGRKK